jgi:tetratricopeptide (TPR) repeat protein
MKINYFFRIVVLFMVFLFTVFVVTPQNLKPDEKLIEEKGILHFNEGEFPKALFYFNKLLGIYPKDPFFNYYTGVSHTEMETQLDEAIYQLKLASLKDVPDNVYFYLGKANHISENYDDALKYYERYLSIGDKNEIEEFQAQRLLQMCRSKVNPETSGPGVEKISSRSGEIPVEGNEAAKTGEEKTTTAGQQEITGYDELVKEALKWQIKADSVRRRSNERRQYLPTISVQGEREKVEKEILLCEEEAYNYQTKADELYLRVKDLEQMMKGKPDAALSSFEQNLSHIESQQFIEHLEEVKPFEEQRTGDKFYNTNDYNKFFRLRDLRIIYDGEGYIKEGDNCMKDVSSFQADLEREKVRISSLTNTKDRKKSQKIIVNLEGKIKKKVIFASRYYQEGNAMKYIVFKDVLADWNAENITNELQKNALKFQELADSNIETAIEFTKKGNNSSKEEEKFDNLLKANAYELLALQNQKKAFDIYAGKTPVKTKQKLASIPKVSEKPVLIAKDTMIAVPEEKEKPVSIAKDIVIAVPEEKEKPPLVDEITEEKPVFI